ncbi:probable RNA-binding protein 46 [Ochlerotatus camptorhynchus]|uniref:probable RNA-binding protein 46 n=1 Tax=Ochlerotatus camptorhynchus TaxID=644619 RepID=UPI0031DC7DF3
MAMLEAINPPKAKCLWKKTVFWGGVEYHTIQMYSQRHIGPPEGIPEPSYEFELYVKNLPRHLFEWELIPLFSTAGFVYQIRLLMCCFSGLNRGVAYVRYTNKEDFRRALVMFHKLQLPGSQFGELYAVRSLNTLNLIMLNIKAEMTDIVIYGFVMYISGGICVRIGHRVIDESKKFAIIQFRSNFEAVLAKRKLLTHLAFFGEFTYLKWYN